MVRNDVGHFSQSAKRIIFHNPRGARAAAARLGDYEK